MAMLKQCGCGKLIDMSAKACDECLTKKRDHRAYDKNVRNQKSKEFYHSKAWRVLSAVVYLEGNGLCVECLKENKLVTGTIGSDGKFRRNVIDHIIPITENWSKRLDKENLQILCHAHHNVKTMNEKKG